MVLSPTFRMAAFQGLGIARIYGEAAQFAGSSLLRAADRYVPATQWLQEARERSRALPMAGRFFQACDQVRSDWNRSAFFLQSVLAEYPQLWSHPQWLELLEIITAPTSTDASGFPLITPEAFRAFRDRVPHLFQNGLGTLEWLDEVEGILSHRDTIPQEGRKSIQRSVQALKTMVNTASVTAPPDLWLARQILETHRQLGTMDFLEYGNALDVEAYAAQHGLDPQQLSHDLHFLYVRGLIDRTGQGFVKGRSRATWIAKEAEIELGYRLMNSVLELKASGRIDRPKAGEAMDVADDHRDVLESAGLIRNGRVTAMGARVFERGPGIFGIIGAYQPYLNEHRALLRATGERPWVERGKNIFASRDANRKTFEDALDRLKEFCEARNFRPKVFIEHALGLGQAVQIFRKKFGEDGVQFVGADFEPAALDQARKEKEAGRLPANMKFVQADIGKPEMVLDFLRSQGIDPRGAVMMVGNGFHEVRNQSDEKMAAVFRAYSDAGIILIFTEETGLTDAQIRESAYNTYHAGFRWVHRTSGQGLRSSWKTDVSSGGWSWSESAMAGNYELLEAYTRGTRTIFPYDAPKEDNPSISVTYFCVPKGLFDMLAP